jgi:hypothetical protein
MASDQELAAARERIAQFEKQEGERAKAAAVATELSKFEFVSGAAKDQVQALISPTVSPLVVSDGSTVLFGPGYKPVDAHIASQLARPEFAHYLRPKGSPSPAQAATQGPQPAAPAAGPQAVGADGRLPGESLGAAMVRVAQARQAQQGDPRLDPSQAFGIGKLALPRK